MGGVLYCVDPVRGSCYGRIQNRFVWVVLGVHDRIGLIGFYDDYLKLVGGNLERFIARGSISIVHRGVSPLMRLLTGGLEPCRNSVPAFVKSFAAPPRSRGSILTRTHDRRHEKRGEPHRTGSSGLAIRR